MNLSRARKKEAAAKQTFTFPAQYQQNQKCEVRQTRSGWILEVNQIDKLEFYEVYIMDCVFCHKEKLVTDFVYEDELVMAFMDMEPINEGHILLVPKEHYLDVDEIPDEILSHLMIISKKIVSVLKEIYRPNGYSIMQNGGEFNDVGHYHLHIFPRYFGDGFGWTYGEDIKNVNAEIAKRIRDRIN